MWHKEKIPFHPCTECGSRLPPHAESCPECCYPVAARTRLEQQDASEAAQSAMVEYKLIRILGTVVAVAGIGAAMADSPIGATVAIVIGGGTYLTGLLGAWWNRRD